MKDNNDVPIEEVNKVIEQSEEEEEDEDDSEEEEEEDDSEEEEEEDDSEEDESEEDDSEEEVNPLSEYIDLSEEAAKKELDSYIVPGSEEVNEVKPVINVKQPQTMKPINTSLLQFQCDKCNFKSYINLDDEIISPLSEKIKCLNCGKKKSVKKRILNITLNGFTEYKKKEEEPYIDPELKDDEE